MSKTGHSVKTPFPATPGSPAASPWSQKYGEKHRLHWIRDFPQGIVAPQRVRIYRRFEHFVLMWWDPTAKSNLSDRVDGDLVSAIARAREIEERLTHFKASGQVRQRRLSHAGLVESFRADLQRRADAGELDPATVRRYAAALGHYLVFCEQADIARAFPHASNVNRDFRLKLAGFLEQRQVAPNGRSKGPGRPMRGQAFVLDTVRALYEWAADPERGNRLPEGFRNPFLRSSATRAVLKGDPLAAPDITLDMALTLVAACDRYQLRLFVPILLFGLRAAEPCYLFQEYLDDQWLRVPNNLDLHYLTKGRRDKRFPLLEELRPFWKELGQGRSQGLLYERRSMVEGREQAPLRGRSLAEIIAEYQRRCSTRYGVTAADRQQLRDTVLHEAGGLTYDHVQGEVEGLARRLGWPKEATLKDLRHLFCTSMNNAAMPESFRRYLMGQAPGRAAIVAYTHLHELKRHYAEAVQREWTPLVEAINRRLSELVGPPQAEQDR